MRFFLFVGLFFIAQSLYAQKSKSISICKLAYSQGAINGTVYYGSDGQPYDTSYYFSGRDNQYQEIFEYSVLYKGDIKEIYSFLNHILNLTETEEPGMSTSYEGIHIRIDKSMGMKMATIYFPDNHSNGYSYYGISQLKKLISSIESHCIKYHISLL